MFSLSQILQVFSSDNNNKLELPVPGYSQETQVANEASHDWISSWLSGKPHEYTLTVRFEKLSS